YPGIESSQCADVAMDSQQSEVVLTHLVACALVLISSQVPVGFTAVLAARLPNVEFAVSPENLRLGQAIAVFRSPERVIVGVREDASQRARIAALFAPFCERIEWMTPESAEMTKHALN